MDTAVVGLYFVTELVRNVCLLIDDSLISKVIFTCLDLLFLFVLNVHTGKMRLPLLFRIYTVVSIFQTSSAVVCRILDNQPEWMLYLNISIASIDAIVVATILVLELTALLRRKAFAEAAQKPLVP